MINNKVEHVLLSEIFSSFSSFENLTRNYNKVLQKKFNLILNLTVFKFKIFWKNNSCLKFLPNFENFVEPYTVQI